MPSHDEVIKHGGLPSVLFPSDHLALVADFKVRWMFKFVFILYNDFFNCYFLSNFLINFNNKITMLFSIILRSVW